MSRDSDYRADTAVYWRERAKKAENGIGYLGDDIRRLRGLLKRVSVEAWFVISGGDDPHDRCKECGCAGYGMLRDALHAADAAIKSKLEKEREG